MAKSSFLSLENIRGRSSHIPLKGCSWLKNLVNGKIESRNRIRLLQAAVVTGGSVEGSDRCSAV